jgi:hypothetical protein
MTFDGMRFKLRKGLKRAAMVLAVCTVTAPVLALATDLPSGERYHGQTRTEPAYDDSNGNLVYLLTPDNAPFPANQVNSHAVAPLFLVVYPTGTKGTFNCMGVPGNCPDHDGLIAAAATGLEPGVYGTNPAAVPGHDHLVGVASTHGDFNVAWHVWVELFTGKTPITHITTLAGLDEAKGAGGILEVDSGITFLCSVVSRAAYMAGTPAA